jgi:hypothetical protein
MKIAIVGPIKDMPGTFLAKGEHEGLEVTAVVKQKGENLALITCKQQVSTIGKEVILAYVGETVAKGKAQKGEEAEFNVRMLTRPLIKDPVKDVAETLAHQGSQLSEALALMGDMATRMEGLAAENSQLKERLDALGAGNVTPSKSE